MDKVLEEGPELGEACLERWSRAPTVCKVQGALRLYTRPQNQRICHETKESPRSIHQHRRPLPRAAVKNEFLHHTTARNSYRGNKDHTKQLKTQLTPF